MQKHKRIYLESFGFTEADFVSCEMCYKEATDIHHIFCKGMGGRNVDYVENLMALCRGCHEEYGDKIQHYDMLISAHKDFCDDYGVKFSDKILDRCRK